MRKLVLSTAGVAVALVTYGATIPAEATPPPKYDVVAGNLDNPRQLTFSPNGALYVAEAGRGGDGPCMTGGEGSTVCFGDSGAVTRVHHGQQAAGSGRPLGPRQQPARAQHRARHRPGEP